MAGSQTTFSETKIKETAHPKFYLFDCGVQRTLAHQIRDHPSSLEKGKLFETYFINEIRLLNSYFNLGGKLSYWRTESGTEVDLIWSRGKKQIGFEIKYSSQWKDKYHRGLKILKENKIITKAYGIYTGKDILKPAPDIEVFPFTELLNRIGQNKAID